MVRNLHERMNRNVGFNARRGEQEKEDVKAE